jgi:hypothetical protein
MQEEYLISVDEFCSRQNIKISFISSLHENGLIEITTSKGGEYLDSDQLLRIEKFIRLYYEFDINLEGIETITHLLTRIDSMGEEIIHLKNRLRLYEMKY